MQRLRALSRVFLVLFMTVHLVTWYILGIHLVGSIGIEGLFSGLSRGIINAGFIFWMLVFVSALLLGRAWCLYLCPIGALLKIFGSVGVGKMRLMNDECIGCGKCTQSCDMQVDVMGELKAHGEIRSSNCIRCFKCTDECPKEAIAFKLSQRGVSLSGEAAARAERATLKRRRLSAFDVIIVILWSIVAVAMVFTGLRQSAPQEIKVFMAVGLLLVIYGFVWTAQKDWSRLGR